MASKPKGASATGKGSKPKVKRAAPQASDPVKAAEKARPGVAVLSARWYDHPHRLVAVYADGRKEIYEEPPF